VSWGERETLRGLVTCELSTRTSRESD